MFFKVVHYIFVILVVLVGLLLLGSVAPIPGNFEIKIVQSGSMEPAIKVGSLVAIKPADDYNIGDVITFGEDEQGEVPTTHRIVDERIVSGEVRYTTQGDANDDPDAQEVGEREIIGKVLFSIPFLGFILDFARQPIGFVLIVGIPLAIVVIDEITNIWTEVRRMREEKKKNKDSDNETESKTTE